MALFLKDSTGHYFSTRPRSICDVTGAGDMVLAMVGFCRAVGVPWEETIDLTNVAAGLEVERLGVVPISWAEIRAELSRGKGRESAKLLAVEQMTTLAEHYRRERRRLVFANGCFDLLHLGHVRYLQAAAQLGDVLLVALNSDRSVRSLKGSNRPIIGQQERAELLAALGCVDHVLLFDEETPLDLLRRIRPDVLVKGGDYSLKNVVGREVVESYGGRVCVTGKVAGVSTTQRLVSLREPALAEQASQD